jgi:hypothetical protein
MATFMDVSERVLGVLQIEVLNFLQILMDAFFVFGSQGIHYRNGDKHFSYPYLSFPAILKSLGLIELKKDFFAIIKMPKQNYYAIRRKEKTAQHFTAAQILIACKKFNVNANWIMGIEKNMFNNQSLSLIAKKPVYNDYNTSNK